MKKLITLIMLVAFLLPMSTAYAQDSTTASAAPGTWVSSINIQNPSDSDASVSLEFFDGAGTSIFTFLVTPVIPAGGSRSLYVPTDIEGLASGQYSVVASSDVEVNVVVNSSSSSPYTAGAYTGLQSVETGTTLYFPGLYKNYYGFYSEVILQNAGLADANISIQFYNQKTGASVGSPFTNIVKPGASLVTTLANLSALPSGNADGIFSAKVTSDQPLAGVASVWTGAMHGEFSNYNAFIGGQTEAVVPALYKNYYNFVSSLTIQNLGAADAAVTITYSNGTTDTATLTPNQAKEFYQPNNPALPSGNSAGVFSAKISADQPVVAIVNIEDKVKGLLASYNGATTVTDTVLCPVVMKEFYGWFSAQTVQNVGTLATDVTITYANGMTRSFTGVDPNETINIIELANAGSVLPATSSLAATITSSNGQPLVAVVQENSDTRYAQAPGDYLLSYTCSNR
ncbi:MAG: hypothetical protein GYA20_05055 [Chloroflexi bacterium]|nr:hypothetical protein [Chloroflexota bacterium]